MVPRQATTALREAEAHERADVGIDVGLLKHEIRKT